MELTAEKMLMIYVLIINLIAFITYGIDKRKAIKGKWRISEAALILLAVAGGSIGALLGMRVFHHKTKKARFFVGVPVILVLQIAAVAFVFLSPWFQGI